MVVRNHISLFKYIFVSKCLFLVCFFLVVLSGGSLKLQRCLARLSRLNIYMLYMHLTETYIRIRHTRKFGYNWIDETNNKYTYDWLKQYICSIRFEKQKTVRKNVHFSMDSCSKCVDAECKVQQCVVYSVCVALVKWSQFRPAIDCRGSVTYTDWWS